MKLDACVILRAFKIKNLLLAGKTFYALPSLAISQKAWKEIKMISENLRMLRIFPKLER